MLDQVRAEVAEAYAKTHARFAQIGTTERAVRSGTRGFREDLIRIENTIAPAIEVVDSLRLLAQARYAYVDSIVDYNRAQFELYVALGQPPADAPWARTRCRPRASPRRDLPPTLAPDRIAARAGPRCPGLRDCPQAGPREPPYSPPRADADDATVTLIASAAVVS